VGVAGELQTNQNCCWLQNVATAILAKNTHVSGAISPSCSTSTELQIDVSMIEQVAVPNCRLLNFLLHLNEKNLFAISYEPTSLGWKVTSMCSSWEQKDFNV
jgi:hypothetical protein